MSFYQRFLVMTGLACVMALLALSKRSGRSSGQRADVLLAACLATVTTALLVVGIVSHTVVRHAIQVAPLALALVLLVRGARSGVAAAAPLFTFWLLVMGAIWLFLFGVARIVSGRFTPTEIALTIVIAVASGLGLAAAYRTGSPAPIGGRLTVVALFGALQYGAMWLSTQPFAR